VKQIFLKPTDDATVSTKIEEFTATIEELATQMADVIKEGKDKNSAEFVDLETKIIAARADSAKVRDEWLKPAKVKADEAAAKVLAGEDFDKLVDQYNEDPGMKSEPIKSQGYAVGKATTRFVEPFKTAALALVNIGDVSPVVASDMGYHILKLVGKLTPGTIPFEQVKDLCKAKALEEKQNSAYDVQVKDWVSKAKVVEYKDRINFPDVPATDPVASPAQ
jgi:parvulin-like peptidyl-prolyl isomerase